MSRWLRDAFGACFRHIIAGRCASASPAAAERVTVPANGSAVWLGLLDRGERELVATFCAGLSGRSRRRWFLQAMPRLPS